MRIELRFELIDIAKQRCHCGSPANEERNETSFAGYHDSRRVCAYRVVVVSSLFIRFGSVDAVLICHADFCPYVQAVRGFAKHGELASWSTHFNAQHVYPAGLAVTAGQYSRAYAPHAKV